MGEELPRARRVKKLKENEPLMILVEADDVSDRESVVLVGPDTGSVVDCDGLVVVADGVGPSETFAVERELDWLSKVRGVAESIVSGDVSVLVMPGFPVGVENDSDGDTEQTRPATLRFCWLESAGQVLDATNCPSIQILNIGCGPVWPSLHGSGWAGSYWKRSFPAAVISKSISSSTAR